MCNSREESLSSRLIVKFDIIFALLILAPLSVHMPTIDISFLRISFMRSIIISFFKKFASALTIFFNFICFICPGIYIANL